MINSKTILASILVALALLTAAVLFLDIDVARWLTCSGPFANQQDKTSDVCKRLDKAP
ncbi:MAG: hypothetical protein N5P05_004010 [Chroococcopsis gigantea SAG 12.99]|jgi:hypothetical protein|nr:hypothetical protein [Chroococcopsis gigantea SAG 12.99]